MYVNKKLYLFLGMHLVIWAILPILWRANLPMDSAEALVWGFINEWGTNKHPPLSGWLAAQAYALGGKNPAALYVLSQILVVGGLFYIYRLGKEFLRREQAVLAALVLEGVAYYNLVTPEYNVNVIALLLWPMTTFYFYRGVRFNRLGDWLLFAVLAGLNLLNKYVSGVLLLCLGLYLLCAPEGRQRLRSWKVYAAAIVALAVVAPHVWWLYQHQWFVIDYFLGRSGEGKVLPYGLAHVVYPLRFVAAQLMTAAPALILLTWWYRKSPKKAVEPTVQKKRFVFFAGVLPLLVMVAISLVFGLKLKSMWGSPVLYMLGIAFMMRFPFDAVPMFVKGYRACLMLMMLFAVAFVGQNMLTTSPKFKLDAADFVRKIGADDYEYVGGSVWLASTVGVYAKAHPQVLFLMDLATNPWIAPEDLRQKGMLVVEENLAQYEADRQNFATLTEPQTYVFEVFTPCGKTKTHKLYYGTIAGENK